MTAKQIAVKRYIVKLNDEERERLNTLIHTGKHPARQLMKARILLKADASEAGEGWSDSRIAAALDTSIDTVARSRQQLVEEGLESVLTRKRVMRCDSGSIGLGKRVCHRLIVSRIRAGWGLAESNVILATRGAFDSTCWLGGGQQAWHGRIRLICESGVSRVAWSSLRPSRFIPP